MSSEKYRTVVRRQHVRLREIQVLVFTLLAAVILGVGVFLGQQAAYSGMGVDPGEFRQLKRDNASLAQQVQEQERSAQLQQDRREVDVAALEMVRRELSEQRGEIADLEQALNFYKSIMAPEALPKGLSLRPVEVVATGLPREYRYRVVAQQEARKHSVLIGDLAMELAGSVNGELQTLDLENLSNSQNSDVIPLRFRYFQVVEGSVTLPEGFEPLELTITARSTKPNKAEARLQVPWQVQEKFSHVGW